MTRDEFDAFVSKLWAHDWHYQMSDDPTVYRKGAAEFTELAKAMKLDERAKVAFKAVRSTASLPYNERDLADTKAKIEEIRNTF